MSESKVREEIARACGLMAERGWVANHDGNASARVGPNRLLCTPTATHKSRITAQELCVTDAKGKQVSGRGRPFSEYAIHLAVYRARADVKAVVHAHPPYATALGVSGRELRCFLPESVVSLGEKVPLVPLTAPGPDAVTAIEAFMAKHDAVIVSGNGVFAWGDDVDQAYCRLELVEHLATIASHAAPWGGPHPLPKTMVDALLEARKKVFGRV
ncbi:MAG: class II aldolase/adducin family protein [Polyangiales bacterium]